MAATTARGRRKPRTIGFQGAGVQAAHSDNESFLVLMFALKLSWEMTRMILVAVNRKGGAGKTTVATNCGV
jgi:hypothetical protein